MLKLLITPLIVLITFILVPGFIKTYLYNTLKLKYITLRSILIKENNSFENKEIKLSEYEKQEGNSSVEYNNITEFLKSTAGFILLTLTTIVGFILSYKFNFYYYLYSNYADTNLINYNKKIKLLKHSSDFLKPEIFEELNSLVKNSQNVESWSLTAKKTAINKINMWNNDLVSLNEELINNHKCFEKNSLILLTKISKLMKIMGKPKLK